MTDFKDENMKKDKSILNVAKESQLKEDKKEIERHIMFLYREAESYSSRLSSILRQLAFVEGGLFWFSKINFNTPNPILIIGFSFLVLYFVFDALQYFNGLIEYEKLGDKLYRDFKVHRIYIPDNYEEEPPKSIGVLFYIKILIIFISSILLIFIFMNGFSSSMMKTDIPAIIFYYVKD